MQVTWSPSWQPLRRLDIWIKTNTRRGATVKSGGAVGWSCCRKHLPEAQLTRLSKAPFLFLLSLPHTALPMKLWPAGPDWPSLSKHCPGWEMKLASLSGSRAGMFQQHGGGGAVESVSGAAESPATQSLTGSSSNSNCGRNNNINSSSNSQQKEE